MLLAVNYHYIGESRYPFPGIHPLSPESFRTQVEEIGRLFEYIGVDDLLAAIRGERKLPSKACLLTFDDGLKEQFEAAVPILEHLEVPAVFFIPGQPYSERRPLTVHVIHWLRSQLDPTIFHECLIRACEKMHLSDRVDKAENGPSDMYFWDDPATRKAKYLLNVLMDDRERAEVVAEMQYQVDMDSGSYYDELYMTREQIKYLDERFAVGSHGYSHCAMATMTEKDIREDIVRSVQVLEEIRCSVKTISYPYGYEGAVSTEVFEVARSCGMEAGFTTERSFNLTLDAPLALARVDTNDAPAGKKPIIQVENDTFELTGAMTMGRTRYLSE